MGEGFVNQIGDDLKGNRMRIVYAETRSAPLMEVVGDFVAHDNPGARGEQVLLSLRPEAGTTKIEGSWIRELWLANPGRPIQLPKRYSGELRLF
jgi:hypothetical protein